jgi:hypothetical protein
MVLPPPLVYSDCDIEGLVQHRTGSAWHSTGSAFCTEPVHDDDARREPRASWQSLPRKRLNALWTSQRLRYRLPAIGALIALCWLTLTLVTSFAGTATLTHPDSHRGNKENQLLLQLANSEEPCVADATGTTAVRAIAIRTTGIVLWDPIISEREELQAVWLASTALCGGSSGTVHMNRAIRVTHGTGVSRSVAYIHDETAYCVQNLMWNAGSHSKAVVECDT